MNLVVFDIDGTLTDTNAVDAEAFTRAVCEHLGIAAIADDWSRFDDVTDAAIFDTLCVEHRGRGAGESDVARVKELLLAHFDQAPRDSFRPIAGAPELLAAIRADAHWTAAFATGAWACSARYKLRAAGLDESWPIASADDARDRASIVRTAIARAGGPFDRIVLAGDAEWDVATARTLRLPFVAVGTRLPGALRDFRDLDAVFANLLSKPVD